MSSQALNLETTFVSAELEKEFIGLLEAHTGIIYKITRVYSQGPTDEQDLKQEIIYQAWKSYPRFEGKSKFSTWLYRIALNTALTHVKKEKPFSSDKTELAQSGGSLSNDTRELLIQYIRSFSDIEKLVIMLHLDGYPNDEIAVISGLTKNHVAVKLHRLKNILAERLKKNEQ